MTELDPATLVASGFDTVIVAAADVQGRLFGRRLPAGSFRRALDGEIAVSSCSLAWDIEQTDRLRVDYAGYHTGWHDLRLVPDLATLRPASWWPGVAIVLADVAEKADDALSPVAPRTILRQQVDSLHAAGYRASIGGELEYYLYRTTYDQARDARYVHLTPTTRPRQQDLISQQTGALEPYSRRLRQVLEAAGIDVRSNDAEWGRGQWELSLGHTDPVEMADRAVLSKLATKVVSAEHGLAATFMARPSVSDTGSSCHLNVSLVSHSDEPAFYDASRPNRMSACMKHAIGGLLRRAPDLMLLYAPTVNSYRRTASDQFAGHGPTWGLDNRTVTCRVVGSTPSSLRIEFRPPGADCNPYIAIAGVLASVRDGIADRTDPPPATTGNAYEAEAASWLPDTLASAVSKFEGSQFALEAFGKEVAAHYAAHGRFEWVEFMSQITDWELARYFEAI